MEIINLSLGQYRENRFNTAIALGNFDGIHIAHQKLIKEMVEDAKKTGLKSGILLFNTHTRALLEGKSPSLLSSNEQKMEILGDLGIEIVYTIDFDQELMQLSPDEFVKNILVEKLNVKSLCVGFDYRFGFKASGNVEILKELGIKYGFKVIVIDPIYRDNVVSSTRIRNYIREGKIQDANELLGRHYSISGEVVDGNKMGRKLGFPTANLKIKDNYIIPKVGIYESNIIVHNKSYRGATSIGTNPTFKNDELKIENHILDFKGDIYGEVIEVRFIRYLRDEIKFDNIEDLKKQINNDVKDIKSPY